MKFALKTSLEPIHEIDEDPARSINNNHRFYMLEENHLINYINAGED
jgi:hypothetical protein